MMRVGFIGLGLMGLPMAHNILRAGFPLSVYNRTKSKAKELAAQGAVVVDSPAALGATCDVIVSIVTGPDDVRAVYLGSDGVAQSPKKDLIVVDMSTIGPTAAKQIAKDLAQHGISFVDAPVTGSTPKAISGELTIFIGGDKAIVEKIEPVLRAMGTTLQYMGSAGMGQAVKMINNYFVGVEAVALAEGMILADSMGLPRAKAAEALGNFSTGMSPVMKLVIGNFATDTYPLIFSLENLKKDVGLAMKEKGLQELALMKLTKETLDQATEAGLGKEDFSTIIKIFTKKETT
jgi:3-hydroxyisobutyrate dehydrogenase